MLKPATTFLSLVLAHFALTAFIKNKWTMDVENVELCPDNDRLVHPIRNLKMNRYNRTHKTMSCDFTFDRPIDKYIGGSMTMERWGDGGWVSMPFMGFQNNWCEYMKKQFFRTNWVEFYRQAGVAHPDECPIPAGNYSVKDYMVNSTTYNFPFFSGRFRSTSRMTDVRTKEDVFCIRYVSQVNEVVK